MRRSAKNQNLTARKDLLRNNDFSPSLTDQMVTEISPCVDVGSCEVLRLLYVKYLPEMDGQFNVVGRCSWNLRIFLVVWFC